MGLPKEEVKFGTVPDPAPSHFTSRAERPLQPPQHPPNDHTMHWAHGQNINATKKVMGDDRGRDGQLCTRLGDGDHQSQMAVVCGQGQTSILKPLDQKEIQMIADLGGLNRTLWRFWCEIGCLVGHLCPRGLR
jgi:hypothetical protein